MKQANVVLVIPGLDGHPGMLAQPAVAEGLWRGLQLVYVDHRQDTAADGLEGMADRAIRTLDAAVGRQAKAIVCGESFGGTVALVLARRYPERVAGLVLLSTFGRYPWPNRVFAQFGLLAWRLLGDTAARVILHVGRVLGVVAHLGWTPSHESLRAYFGHPFPHLAAYRTKCSLLLGLDARPWLRELHCPTLIVSGAFDPVVPASASSVLAASIVRANLHRLRAGHTPHLVQPAEIGQLIADWLADRLCEPVEIATDLN